MSTVPTVRAWLLTNIVTAVDDAAVLVCLDEPGTYRPLDIVSIGQVDRAVEPLTLRGNSGTGRYLERFSIELEIACARAGDDAAAQLAAETQAWALLDLIEDAIRAAPTLGGSILEARPRSNTAVGELVLSDDETAVVGRRCSITTALDMYAEI